MKRAMIFLVCIAATAIFTLFVPPSKVSADIGQGCALTLISGSSGYGSTPLLGQPDGTIEIAAQASCSSGSPPAPCKFSIGITVWQWNFYYQTWNPPCINTCQTFTVPCGNNGNNSVTEVASVTLPGAGTYCFTAGIYPGPCGDQGPIFKSFIGGFSWSGY